MRQLKLISTLPKLILTPLDISLIRAILLVAQLPVSRVKVGFQAFYQVHKFLVLNLQVTKLVPQNAQLEHIFRLQLMVVMVVLVLMKFLLFLVVVIFSQTCKLVMLQVVIVQLGQQKWKMFGITTTMLKILIWLA